MISKGPKSDFIFLQKSIIFIASVLFIFLYYGLLLTELLSSYCCRYRLPSDRIR
uniref:Uncharacterized protein n=1 Tax=Ascaris lumbricoides TaxID=6252 RepID=A0A0M3IXE0_ASCLU